MTLSELRMLLTFSIAASTCVGSVARAQQSAASATDSLFTVYANKVAASLPCEEARKKVKDSALHLVYDRQKAMWAKNHGVIKGTAYANGKTNDAIIIGGEGDTIPLDSASIAFVNKDWIRKENCR